MNRFDRRAFIGALACAPFASIPRASAATAYVCPPCGLPCDKLVFGAPGSCPTCGMTLITEAERAAPYGKAEFPNGLTQVRFPIEVIANAVYVPALVNGKGPHLFALDTGSTNSVIASELAHELGLRTGETFQSSGAGSNSNAAAKLEQLDFVLPQGLARSTKQGASISMSGLWPLIGKPFYGDLGYDIVQPFVVEIDYGRQMLALHDPATYVYHGAGTTLPMTMFGNYDPQIAGAISVPGRPPIPVRFTIDTGAGGTIISTPLVDKYDLVRAVGRTFTAQDHGVGAGEPAEVWARLSSMRIGPYVIDKPVVALSRDKVGSLANEAISVNLGGNVLRRFTVVIDYAKRQLTLEPNHRLHDWFDADGSGLLLRASGSGYHTFVVTSVIALSPGAAAGVLPGDRIAAVDGKPAEQFVLWQLQDALKKSGTTVALTIVRGSSTFVRPLRLRALV